DHERRGPARGVVHALVHPRVDLAGGAEELVVHRLPDLLAQDLLVAADQVSAHEQHGDGDTEQDDGQDLRSEADAHQARGQTAPLAHDLRLMAGANDSSKQAYNQAPVRAERGTLGDTAIRIQGVTKSYAGHVAVRDL